MAVTTTYLYPVSGAIAPTALQSADRVTADITATADGDTTATVTHNFGLSVGDLAAGKPVVVITALLQSVALLAGWAVTAYATNSITLTKSTAGSSSDAAAQIRVEVHRPHSIIGSKLVA